MDAALEFLMKIPTWLNDFDRLQIPAWGLFLAAAIVGTAFVLALREFAAWFLKTNLILDELQKLEEQAVDFESEMKSLQQAVRRLEATASPPVTTAATAASASIPTTATPVPPAALKDLTFLETRKESAQKNPATEKPSRPQFPL